MNRETTIVWFRRDLRLADNRALTAAAASGAVVPVFIWAPHEEAPWQPGGASRWWLHHSLAALDGQLREHGSRLIMRQGDSLAALRDIARAARATRVVWNRLYEPALFARDAAIQAALVDDGLRVESFAGAVLHEPASILTKTGGPYRVFTPYYRATLERSSPLALIRRPTHIASPATWPPALELADLALLPTIDWDAGLREHWRAGEQAAQEDLKRFFRAAAKQYQSRRDEPDGETTSRLSPRLHWGEISPRQAWQAAARAADKGTSKAARDSIAAFQRQLIWREFAQHQLFHFPASDHEPLRAEFNDFPWAEDPRGLTAWQRGRTGYPIVDAGMRQLWSIGWMHNRVRLIAASFLVKDLLIPWQQGAAWFWDTLVDADLANNTLGWQWIAGCGSDAAPYFRVFNPVAQGEKFDPAGKYVRRWVPELARLPDKWIHRPWEAPREILQQARVRLGENYPRPIVDHAQARLRALEAYAELKRKKRAAGDQKSRV